ncbi:MAG: GTP-binding protein [Lachnospiraceae bacterium]|nr:GTP-binding protein [Lachnospiraceae bacterium]
MKEVLVFFITGFMDSGKTSLINETLYGSEFSGTPDKKLIICCEDGEIEYDEEKLKTVNAKLVMLENEEEFNEENLKRIAKEYDPDNVFIEYNGTWEVAPVYEMKMPAGWVLAQAIATVDSQTFEMYQNNMRAMMNEILFGAELVVFNRCDENTNKRKFRGAVKAINRPAQIIYELMDGKVDTSEEELPFDIDADVIEITDADYAIWFTDCMDKPKKYEGKHVHFLGLVYNPEDGSLKRNVFVPGRFAMTCCVDDIQFLGMKCKYDEAYTLKHKSWVDFTGKIKIEFAKEYRGLGPVLYAEKVVAAEKPEDELVYFT